MGKESIILKEMERRNKTICDIYPIISKKIRYISIRMGTRVYVTITSSETNINCHVGNIYTSRLRILTSS